MSEPKIVAECAHEYVEAQNYGQERDNVECRRCGQLWVRFDRAALALADKVRR